MKYFNLTKSLLLTAILGILFVNVNGQLLKKLKQKANQVTDKVIDKKVDKEMAGEGSVNGSDNNQPGNQNNQSGGKMRNKTGGGLNNTAPPDVMQQITDAEKAHGEAKYSDARYSIQQALVGIEIQLGRELLKSLPQTVNGMQKDSSKNIVTSSQWGWNNLTVQTVYNQQPEKQMTITIGNNTFYSGIANLYFANAGYVQANEKDQNIKQTKVKDYRAIIQYDDSKGYTLMVQLGQMLLLVWECVNFTNEDDVMKTASSFDIDKIKKIITASSTTSAQDFKKDIANAKTSYNAGKLEDAHFALLQSMQEVDIKIGQEVLKLLPAQMDSMKANTKDDQVTGTIGFIGSSIHRSYGVANSGDLNIISNSPLISTMNAFLNTPLLGGLMKDENNKIIKVHGYKGRLQKSTTDNGQTNFTIDIPLNSSLFTFRVNNCSSTQIMAMAETIPLDDIAKLIR